MFCYGEKVLFFEFIYGTLNRCFSIGFSVDEIVSSDDPVWGESA